MSICSLILSNIEIDIFSKEKEQKKIHIIALIRDNEHLIKLFDC